ncbi:MAG: hypothetical protein NHB32_21105 [Fischerella sp. CENA71]|nr:hypothetical protein [Fischerella sp. CENA71]
MKVVEFAKKHEITVNQAKKAVKVVLGVDVSKDRTLTPDELAKLEAVLRDPQLSTSQQHKVLPSSNAQFIQNGVQSSPGTMAEPGTEQSFQPDIQPSEAVIAEPRTEQLFQADVQPASNLDNLDEKLDASSKLDAENVQPNPTENALTVSNSEDAVGRVQRLGTAEKDLREGTVQLKTEISKAQGRGAGVATGLAFMQGLLEGEQEVLDMFTNQSLEVFDQLQATIDQQVADISQGTGDLLGKISSQRAKNQKRLQAIRSRVANLIHKA